MHLKNKQILLVTIAFTSFLWVFYCYLSSPTYEEIKRKTVGSDQVLLDKNDQVIQVIRTDFNKRRVTWLPLTSFSKNLVKTVIKIEDKRFYSHLGVDPIALGRAFKSLVTDKKIEGGSTITMQLSDLINQKVLVGNKRIKKGFILNKILQIHRAFFINLNWSKSEVLEAYLNLIHLKGEYQGVPAFTRGYLNKSPQLLNFKESVLIASLIREPNSNKSKLLKRTCLNTKKFKNEFDCKKMEPLVSSIFNTRPRITKTEDLAPHLARKLFNENINQTVVKTHLDYNLQEKVYSILKKNLSYLQDNNVTDISAVVLENKTGKVISYIGAISEYSNAKDVDGADSPRQAGSTLKPFLYARAFDKKLITPASIIKDDSTVLPWAGGLYRPKNYGSKFHGNVSVRQALASSLNVPAVKVVKILGLSETYAAIKALGFSDIENPDFYGASIALGAAEIRLHELANAYRGIYNDGIMTPLNWSLGNKENEINDNDNDNIDNKEKKIMSKEAAFLIKSILSDSNARSIGFGWDSALETSFWTAVKTGTSKGLRDNWCVGFSDKYTVAVWAGNFSAKAMKGVSGVSGAAPSWYEIINHLHKNTKSKPPVIPENIVAKKIKFDWKVGEQTEFFIVGTEPLSNRISLPEKNDISITFPAAGSTLATNPHLASQSKAIFLRYKGKAPKESYVFLNNKKLGNLTNPFKINDIYKGFFKIVIKDKNDKILDSVDFEVK